LADVQLVFTKEQIDALLAITDLRILSSGAGIDAGSTDSEIASAKAIYNLMLENNVSLVNPEGVIYVSDTIRFCFFNSVICVETLEEGVWTSRNLMGHHINAPNFEVSEGFFGLQQTSKEASFQTVQDVYNFVKPGVEGNTQIYGDYRKTTVLMGNPDEDNDVLISKFAAPQNPSFGAAVTTTPTTSPYQVGDEEPIVKDFYTHDIPMDITSLLTGDQVGVLCRLIGWYDDVSGGDQDNGDAYIYDVSNPFGDETGKGLGENEIYGDPGFTSYTDFSHVVLANRMRESNKVYNSLEEYKHLNGGGFDSPQGTLEATLTGTVPSAQWNQQQLLAKDKLYYMRLVTETAYTLKGDGTLPKIETIVYPYEFETVATREEVDYATIKNTDDLTTDQTIAVVNTYQDLVYTTEAFANSSNFSITGGVITYTGSKDILLEVNLSMSLQSDTNNTTVIIALAKNGVEDKGIRSSRKMSSTTDTGSISVSSSILISTNDIIKWTIKADQTAIVALDNIQSVITKIVDL